MAITRPRYVEEQVLHWEDLQAEQDHRLGARRRHNVAAHGWGIVFGLGLVVGERGLGLNEGLAIDGYGRALKLSAALPIPEDWYEGADRDEIDLWLCYRRRPVATPRRGRYDCGAEVHERWLDDVVLRHCPVLSDRCIDPADPLRLPAEVFPWEDTPTDDEAPEWPVYLGRVRRPAGPDDHATVLPARRRYASLVGARITPPGAAVEAGWRGGWLERPSAFAIRAGAVDRMVLGLGKNNVIHGRLNLRRDTARNGDLILWDDGPSQQPSPGIAFKPDGRKDDAAAAWQVYRRLPEKKDEEAPEPLEQLRFEIGHPGDTGQPDAYRFAIGSMKPDDCFIPGLSVDAAGTVTVRGRLVVEGQITESPVAPNLEDPRFKENLLKAWLSTPAAAPLGPTEQEIEAALDAKVKGLEFSDDGGALRYRVEMTYLGGEALGKLALYELLCADGRVLRRARVWPASDCGVDEPGKSLLTGASETAEVTFAAAPGSLKGKRIDLAVLIIGERTDGTVMSTKAEDSAKYRWWKIAIRQFIRGPSEWP